MKWKIIDKSACKQPESGSYRDWKELLAHEGDHQCVYCCISENNFGGLRNFHVEHYRPKSIHPELQDIITNLFLACGICNTFKKDDWPAEPSTNDFTYPHYPDPSQVDWSSFLDVEEKTGITSSKHMTGRYLIERLYLNRPQMIVNRRIEHIISQLNVLRSSFEAITEDEESITNAQSRRLNRLLLGIIKVMSEFRDAIPYRDADTKRRSA